MSDCIFCSLPPQATIMENELAFAIYDKFPKSKGHTLILTKRHAENFFDITDEEMLAIKQLTFLMKDKLKNEDASIQGFKFQTNIGKVAGQEIMHCHFHLIPKR